MLADRRARGLHVNCPIKDYPYREYLTYMHIIYVYTDGFPQDSGSLFG